MAMEVQFSPKDWTKLSKRFNEIRRRALNPEKALKPAAAKLDTVIQESFERSESPGGEDWPDLAPSTKKQRRQSSPKPLVNSGQTKQQTHVKAERNIINFGTSGGRSKIAMFHHVGAGNNPRRAFLPINESLKADFSSGRAKRWLNRTANRVVNYILHGKPSPTR